MQILSGLILLAVLIVFHELGHFLFAKMLGVRVLTFSLGFGPKLLSFKRGDTEYRLSAIPLGGYIRMFGESLEEELSEADKKVSFMHQPIWRKSLIAVAGPLFNFILPVVLFFFLLLGTESYYSPKIGTLIKGGAAELAGILPDDEIKSINGQPMTSFSTLAKTVANHPSVELDFLVKRKNAQGQDVEISFKIKPEAKVEQNPLEKGKSVGRIGIMPARQKPVIWLSDDSPLAGIGFKDFDEITAIDGVAVTSARSLPALWSKIAPGSQVTFRRKIDDQDQEMTLKIAEIAAAPTPKTVPAVLNKLDDGEELSVEQKHAIEKSAHLLQAETSQVQENSGLALANGAITKVVPGSHADALGLSTGDRIVAVNGEGLASMVQVQHSLLNQANGVQILGVFKKDLHAEILVFKLPIKTSENIDMNSDLASVFGIETAAVFDEGEVKTRQVGFAEASARAFGQTADIAKLTAKSIWMLIKGDVPASQIGGPIMLFDVAQKAAKKGMSYYIFIMCLLSVNLGLLNLLPIPALDGGHLLLFSIEAIQRKPLSMKTRGVVTQIGVAIVLFLMGLAIFNDLSRLF